METPMIPAPEPLSIHLLDEEHLVPGCYAAMRLRIFGVDGIMPISPISSDINGYNYNIYIYTYYI